jgi:hypothetical protein
MMSAGDGMWDVEAAKKKKKINVFTSWIPCDCQFVTHLQAGRGAAAPATQCCSWRAARRSSGSGPAPRAAPPPAPGTSPAHAHTTATSVRLRDVHARARQAEVRRPGAGAVAAAYESVALGAAGEAVRDDDGLQDVAVPLEVLPEPLRGRLPRQPAHEHLRQRRVAEPRPRPAGGRRPRRGRRRRRGCCHHERARTHTGGKPRWRGAAAAGLASREGGARGELLLCLRRGTPPCRALALSFGNGPASPLLYKTTL